MRAPVVPFVSLAALVAGCAAAPADSEPAEQSFPLVDPGSPEEHGILAFLNRAETDRALLDVDVGLDRRAAENLIARRDGADAIFGTADDAPFTSVEDVDSVRWVGASALQKLLDWARTEGFVDAAGDARDRAILGLLADPATDFRLLDEDVGLDRRAADNLVGHRDGPDGVVGTADDRRFRSVAEVDAVPYVGPAALEALARYGLDNGYGEGEIEPARPCVIFSEYTEGSGNYNKAVEIYNCGDRPVALSSIGLCLVRNDDTTCSNRAIAGSGTLEPGAVWILCRSRAEALSDPFPTLARVCDAEIGAAASFDGDDRLVLFHDTSGDGVRDGDEGVLDTFGDPGSRPWGTPWAETSYRRCDLTPREGGAFDVRDLYAAHRASDYTHLGVPPTNDCGDTHVGAEGDDCLGHEHCAERLRCYGRPSDGSTPYGKCVDPTPLPGEGDRCDRWSPCQEGLVCAGWTLWGEGTCNPQWMAGRFKRTVDLTIHDGSSGGISPWVVVYGLASVPVDLEVVAHITHPRPTDLIVTLIDPNGEQAVLWDRSPELSEWSRSHVPTGISRDDEVNGRWHLRFRDVVTGEEGTFHEWSLFVVSRWD